VAILLAVASPAVAQSGYILDGFGGVHAFNGAPVLPNPTPYFGFDIAASIVIIPSGDGYFVLDKFGGVHPGGAAVAPSPVPPYVGREGVQSGSKGPSDGQRTSSRLTSDLSATPFGTKRNSPRREVPPRQQPVS